MCSTYCTRSTTCNPTASTSNSQPTHIPAPTSLTSPSCIMSDSDHKNPPHQSISTSAPSAPPVPPPATLQDAIGQLAQLVQLLTTQFQPMQQPVPGQAPIQQAGGAHSHVKTHDPDPYDGTDPSKLCAFLSQCCLAF